MTPGETIKHLRKELDLKQSEFRQMIGIGVRKMSDIENDLIPLGERDKKRIIDTFSLPADYFESLSGVLLPPLPDPAVRLQELRTYLGKTQAELADELGVAQPNVASMEAGKRPVGKYIKRTIFQAYNVNPDWWDTGTGPMFKQQPSQPRTY